MLIGLASHEPFFTVLREEFRPTSKKPCDLCHHRGHKLKQCPGLPEGGVDKDKVGWGTERAKKGPKFLFIDLNVLRDFLGKDLGHRATTTTKSKESRQHVERLIDDWIFICFFVGNDFLPHLPSLRIREGAVDRLVEIYKKLPKEGGNASYIHTNGKPNLNRLEFLFSELGKVEDKIFVDRHNKVAVVKVSAKRKAMEKFDKLSAQQQFEMKHGKDKDQVSVWMTALANEANEEGVFDAAKEKAAKSGESAEDGSVAFTPVQMPSWALSPTDGLDPEAIAELQQSGVGGTMSIRRELSTEAEQWLAAKKAREASRSGRKPWEGKAGAADGAGAATGDAAESNGYEDLTSLFKAGSDLAPPWAAARAIPRPAEVDQIRDADADFGGEDANAAGGGGGGAGKQSAGASVSSAFSAAIDAKAKQEGKGKGKEQDKIRLWEEGWKERYYLHKFQVNATDGAFKGTLIHEYVKGLCWVLEYYFQGVPSWTWFYPYHYAPFASDCVNVRGLDVSFEAGSKPFRPLEQLLAVFPPASAHLIPESFGDLMVDSASPIIDNYPLDFETDLNGFKFAWQGVTLLPFVEEDALLEAASAAEAGLDAGARRRNMIGQTRLYTPSTNSLSDVLLALPRGANAAAAAADGAGAGAAVDKKGAKKSKKKKKKQKIAAAEAAAAAAAAASSGEPAAADQWADLDPSTTSLTLGGKVKVSVAKPRQLVPGQTYSAPKDSTLADVACTAVCVEYIDPPFPAGKGHSYIELPGTRWPTKGVGDYEKPCFDFANGKCKFGTNCRFSHTAALPDRDVGTGTGDDAKPCFDYAAGRCKFGKRCKFAHIGKPGQGGEHSTVYCRDLAAGHCKWGTKCFFSHDVPAALPPPRACDDGGGPAAAAAAATAAAAAPVTIFQDAAEVAAFAAAAAQARTAAPVSAFAAAAAAAGSGGGGGGAQPVAGPVKKRKAWRSGGAIPFAKKATAPPKKQSGGKKKKRKKSEFKK